MGRCIRTVAVGTIKGVIYAGRFSGSFTAQV